MTRLTAVHLTDDQLIVLAGLAVDEETQAKVDAARRRIDARESWPDLSADLSGFVADVVHEAKTAGLLLFARRPINWCPLCGTKPGYVLFKSGYRKGKPDYERPKTLSGFEFAHRFVTFRNAVALGGCSACIEPLLPVLKDALRGVQAERPGLLRAPGEPVWKRHRNRHCTKCGWEGHEGQMRWARTILGDGTYPAGCPSCNAENGFGRTVIEGADGYQVVEVAS